MDIVQKELTALIRRLGHDTTIALSPMTYEFDGKEYLLTVDELATLLRGLKKLIEQKDSQIDSLMDDDYNEW